MVINRLDVVNFIDNSDVNSHSKSTGRSTHYTPEIRLNISQSTK